MRLQLKTIKITELFKVLQLYELYFNVFPSYNDR